MASVMVAPMLSPREIEILVALARGSTPKEIATSLDLSLYTVREYTRSARLKLGARSTEQAVAIAKDRHLVPRRRVA